MRKLHRPGLMPNHRLDPPHHMHHHVHADIEPPPMLTFPA